MKFRRCFIPLAALGLSTAAAASAVAPSVTGTITQVTPSGADSRVVIRGHTYTVTRQTKGVGASGTLEPGQKVTFFLSPDGRTVILAQAPHPQDTQP